MRKNTAVDLHNHLMVRVEALSDETLTGEKLDNEIRRTDATIRVASTIIDHGRLVLAAERHFAEYGVQPDREHLPMLTTNKGAGRNGDGA